MLVQFSCLQRINISAFLKLQFWKCVMEVCHVTIKSENPLLMKVTPLLEQGHVMVGPGVLHQ